MWRVVLGELCGRVVLILKNMWPLASACTAVTFVYCMLLCAGLDVSLQGFLFISLITLYSDRARDCVGLG